MEIAEGPQKGKNISLDEFFDMTGAKRDTTLPLMGRIESQMNKIRGTSSKLDDAMKEYENIYKPADESKTVFGLKDYETAGWSDAKKRIVELEEKLGRLNASAPGFRERAKPLIDEIESLKNEQSLVLPPLRGTNEIDALETMTRNRAGTEFVTAYVDDIYKNAGVTASVDVPKKRAAAREFLYNMLKKETDLLPPGKGGTLESVISETDYKYIMEGGGGALGDPLVLVKKYFGDEIARRVPLDSRVEIIDAFVDNVRFTKDRAGFRTDDPRFNPDDIPEFKHGGLAKILEV